MLIRGTLFLLLTLSTHLYGKDRITVVLSDFKPWTILNESGPTGIDIDLINRIGKDLNIEIDYFPCPWARCLEMMKQGKIDFASNLFKLPEREKYLVYFEKPYLKGSIRAFYVKTPSKQCHFRLR